MASSLDFARRAGVNTANKLRELAAWYRQFAERAGDPWIWEARLRTAEKLEAEADRLEAKNPPPEIETAERSTSLANGKRLRSSDLISRYR